MEEREFLEKFGNEMIGFSEMHNYRSIYKNMNYGFWCSGKVDYKDSIKVIETVKSIFDLEDFKFGWYSW